MTSFVAPRPNPRARLRELLAAPGPLIAPGAYDALSARLVQQAGFDVVYMTGFGTMQEVMTPSAIDARPPSFTALMRLCQLVGSG